MWLCGKCVWGGGLHSECAGCLRVHLYKLLFVVSSIIYSLCVGDHVGAVQKHVAPPLTFADESDREVLSHLGTTRAARGHFPGATTS